MTYLLRPLTADAAPSIDVADPPAPTPASEAAVRLALRLRETCTGAAGRALLFVPACDRGDAARVVADAVRGLVELGEGPVLVLDLRTASGEAFHAPPSPADHAHDGGDGEPSFDAVTTAYPFSGRRDTVTYAASPEFQAYLARARDRFPFVLCLADPVRVSVETLLAAAACDGAVLAVTSGRTTRADVQRTTEQLRRSRAPIAGFVVDARRDGKEA